VGVGVHRVLSYRICVHAIERCGCSGGKTGVQVEAEVGAGRVGWVCGVGIFVTCMKEVQALGNAACTVTEHVLKRSLKNTAPGTSNRFIVCRCAETTQSYKIRVKRNGRRGPARTKERFQTFVHNSQELPKQFWLAI
jgi:hypothetical protein